MKRTWVSAVLLVGCGLLLGLAFRALAAELQEVLVQNFPELQKVEGRVAVDGVVRHSQLVRREELQVTPARRNAAADLTPAGVVETDGFTHVVLSLAGEVRDRYFEPGTVGALLVPDEEPVLKSLREAGRLEFPVEVVATVDPKSGGGRFASQPTSAPLAFPRYRVYLYNTSDKSVEAHLYLYLTQ